MRLCLEIPLISFLEQNLILAQKWKYYYFLACLNSSFVFVCLLLLFYNCTSKQNHSDCCCIRLITQHIPAFFFFSHSISCSFQGSKDLSLPLIFSEDLAKRVRVSIDQPRSRTRTVSSRHCRLHA